jgi:hypothetical protein
MDFSPPRRIVRHFRAQQPKTHTEEELAATLKSADSEIIEFRTSRGVRQGAGGCQTVKAVKAVKAPSARTKAVADKESHATSRQGAVSGKAVERRDRVRIKDRQGRQRGHRWPSWIGRPSWTRTDNIKTVMAAPDPRTTPSSIFMQALADEP